MTLPKQPTSLGQDHELVFFGKSQLPTWSKQIPQKTSLHGTPLGEVKKVMDFMNVKGREYIKSEPDRKVQLIQDALHHADITNDIPRVQHMFDDVIGAIGDKIAVVLPFLKFSLSKAHDAQEGEGQHFIQYVQSQFHHEIEKNVLSEYEFLSHILDKYLIQSTELLEQLFGRDMLQKVKYYEKNNERALVRKGRELLEEHQNNFSTYRKVLREILELADAWNLIPSFSTVAEKVAYLQEKDQEGALESMLQLTPDEAAALRKDIEDYEIIAKKVEEYLKYDEKVLYEHDEGVQEVVQSMEGVLHDDPHQKRSVFEHMQKVLHYLDVDPQNPDHVDSLQTLFAVATHHYKMQGKKEQNLLVQLHVALQYLEEVIEKFAHVHDVELEMKFVHNLAEDGSLFGVTLHIDVWQNGQLLNDGDVINTTQTIFEALMKRHGHTSLVRAGEKTLSSY